MQFGHVVVVRHLLRGDDTIFLDILDVLVGLESSDVVVIEFSTKNTALADVSQRLAGEMVTYEKPLIMVYSWPILPPWSMTFCLTLPQEIPC